MPFDYKLYDGEITMTFDPEAHMYRANGELTPSVTAITKIIDKPALLYWAVNQTTERIAKLWQPGKEYTEDQIKAAIIDAKGSRFRTSKKAMDIGSQAHDWIEQYIKAKIYRFEYPPLPDYKPVERAVNAYLDWEEANDVVYHSSERKVYSKIYRYSGTVDIDFVVNGRRLVGDLKTSKAIYPEYYLQCAAYAQALSEELLHEYKGIVIIRLGKFVEDFEIVEISEYQKLFKVFDACLTVWKWKNEQK
jgi:hypothetical protein